MEQPDNDVWRWEPDWPAIGISIVRSAQKGGKLTLFLSWTTAETWTVCHWTFTWLLQRRTWWPPVFFFRGWIKWADE